MTIITTHHSKKPRSPSFSHPFCSSVGTHVYFCLDTSLVWLFLTRVLFKKERLKKPQSFSWAVQEQKSKNMLIKTVVFCTDFPYTVSTLKLQKKCYLQKYTN